ncbi:MAG: metallophosphoesterase, partial [Candidatus Brocadiae bacterium]|nr:metallophosphoesterase [Candidatus Brocadiia bacterium]
MIVSAHRIGCSSSTRHGLVLGLTLIGLACACVARAAPIPPPAGSFTIAVIPDTQTYAEEYPEVFEAQTQWIADNHEAHNIKYVLHLGDVTNDNSTEQWDRGLVAMNNLNGAVPYAIATGNHDYGTGGDAGSRDTLFNDSAYFGTGSAYASQPSIGGFYEAGKTDNSYHTFNAGGRDWIVLSLEWAPRDEVVEWGNQVMEAHPDHTGILSVHAYSYSPGRRYDWGMSHMVAWNPHWYTTPEPVNDGQELWDKLVSQHNFALTLSGHYLLSGTGLQTSINPSGGATHQLLQNYQKGVQFTGGYDNGFLRLYEVQPDGITVDVKTYSPTQDLYRTEPDQQFTIALVDDPVAATYSADVRNDLPLVYYDLRTTRAGDPVEDEAYRDGELDGAYTGTGLTASDYDGTGAHTETSAPTPRLSEWSMEAWVKVNALGTSQTVLSNDRDGWNDDVLLGLCPDGTGASALDRWAIVHQDDGTATRTVVADGADAAAYQWYHLVATSDGSALRLYVDGSPAGEAPASGGDLDLADALLRVGQSFASADGGRPFNGEIAQVSLFDRALTLSEVTSHRLAAFSQVLGANVANSAATDSSAWAVTEVPEQGV